MTSSATRTVSASPGLIKNYLSLIRFSHTVFALPFALMAAILAWYEGALFRGQDLLGLVLCMVFARSAAMAFNRLVDRKWDAENPRTAGRHLPAGLLSVGGVQFFTIACSLLFVAATLLFLPNRWPVYLSVPVLLFLLSYSYVKRFSMWAHYWLAAALMLSPLAAWIAITGTLALPPVLLAAVIFFWVGGFDIIYACQDAEFDHRAGLYSIPSRLGIKNSLRLAAVSHAVCFLALLGFWYFSGLGLIFLGGVAAIGLLLIWQHAIVRPEDLSRVGIAFFNINAVISLGLLAVGMLDLWIAT